MAEEFFLPWRQQDYRCPCGIVHLRAEHTAGAVNTCHCGREFTFMAPLETEWRYRLGQRFGNEKVNARR